MKNLIRWTVAITLSVAGLWFALRGTDWATLTQAFRNVKSPAWLALFPVVTLIEFSLRSLRWRFLLWPLKKLPFKVVFPITAAGFFLNNVLPFRAGEIARAFWTSRRADIALSSSVALLAADRLLDMLALLTLVAWVIFRKSSLIQSSAALWTFGLITIGGLGAVLLMARYPAFSKRQLERLLPVGRVRTLAEEFLEGFAVFGSLRAFLGLYLLTLSFWCMIAACLWFVATLFGLTLSPTDGAFILIALCFGSALPSAPGYVGTFEAAGVAALHLLGYGRDVAVPLILTMHAFMIFDTALLGLPSLLVSGLSGLKRSQSKSDE